MNRIWFIRHAESRAQTGETDDLLDPDLSARGLRQAARLRERLMEVDPDRVLISPLQRAWRTCVISGAEPNRSEFDSRLVELDWGRRDTYAPILPVTPPPIAAPDRHDAWLWGDDERVTSLAGELFTSKDESLLVFAHWGVFHRLLLEFFGEASIGSKARAIMDNASVSLLEISSAGERLLRYWNDTGHAADMIREGDAAR